MKGETVYNKLFKSATAIVMDVDGTLTDGELFLTDSGDELRTLNIHDTCVLEMAVQKGFPVAIISGEQPKPVIRKLKQLGIKEIIT